MGNNVCLKSMVRSMDPHISTLWYGQDAAGAIWKIDIVVSHTVSEPMNRPQNSGIYALEV